MGYVDEQFIWNMFTIIVVFQYNNMLSCEEKTSLYKMCSLFLLKCNKKQRKKKKTKKKVSQKTSRSSYCQFNGCSLFLYDGWLNNAACLFILQQICSYLARLFRYEGQISEFNLSFTRIKPSSLKKNPSRGLLVLILRLAEILPDLLPQFFSLFLVMVALSLYWGESFFVVVALSTCQGEFHSCGRGPDFGVCYSDMRWWFLWVVWW